MKSMYEKPVVKVTTVITEPFLAETLEHGVIGEGDDMAKESSFEEVETGIPDQFTSIWGDEAEED